ncbi:MAG: elongation factor G, partial [Myxococcales bacterium]|nr:elongation factor G [Myxococcales bacterium]
DRGEGYRFVDQIVGGVVPKRFIPAVEAGCGEFFKQGPLGFPVVDVEVTLYDGQFHAVDSSDQAFRTCASQAMREALPKCKPVLLEPMLAVRIAVPSDYTAGVQRAISSRRGTLLDYAQRPGWQGWDLLTAHMPQAEIHDLIQDLRSTTLGVGTYTCTFDHLAEVRDEKVADAVVSARRAHLDA